MKRLKKKTKAVHNKFSGELDLRIPIATMDALQEIALEAQVSVQDVIRVCLATQMRKERASRPTGGRQ